MAVIAGLLLRCSLQQCCPSRRGQVVVKSTTGSLECSNVLKRAVGLLCGQRVGAC